MSISIDEFGRLQTQLISLKQDKMLVEEERSRLEKELQGMAKSQADLEKRLQKAENVIAKSKDKRAIAELTEQVDQLKRDNLEGLTDYQEQHRALRDNLTHVYEENAQLLAENGRLKGLLAAEGRGDARPVAAEEGTEGGDGSGDVGPAKPGTVALPVSSDAADVDERIERLRSERDNALAELQRLREEKDGLDMQMRAYESMEALNAKYKQKNDALRARLEKQDERISELEGAAAKRGESGDKATADNVALTNKMTFLQQQAAQAEKRSQQKIQTLNVELSETKSKLQAVTQELGDAKDQVKHLKAQRESFSKVAKEKGDAAAKLEGKCERLEADLAACRDRVDDLEANVSETKRAQLEGQEEHEVLREEYARATRELTSTTALVGKQREKLEELEDKIAKLTAAHAEEISSVRMSGDAALATIRAEKEGRVSALEAELQRVTARMLEAEDEAEAAKQAEGDLAAEVERVAAAAASQQRESEGKIAGLEGKVKELEGECGGALERVAQMEEDEKDLREKIVRLEQEISDSEARHKIELRKAESMSKDVKKALEKERDARKRLEEDLRRRDDPTLSAPPPVVRSSSVASFSRSDAAGSHGATDDDDISHRELVDENNVLVSRLAKMQKEKWAVEERLRAMEEMVDILKTDVDQKGAIIQQYVSKERAGGAAGPTSFSSPAPPPPTPSPTSPANAMASLQEKFGGFFKSPKVAGKAEGEAKMQAVLEEALFKNIQLQQDYELLGEEVARLMEENKVLRAKQG